MARLARRDSEHYYTVRQAAAVLGVSIFTVYDWYHRGVLAGRTFGRTIRISRHACDDSQASTRPAPLRPAEVA